MNEKPILSICIPTYNRADYLRKTLDSIVAQEEFRSNQVEVIISDNASTDNTQDVVMHFCEKYNNIFYYRNEENVRDRNFPIVIDRAQGIYRKLCNDTMEFKPGSIRLLISVIKKNMEDRPVIFWKQNNKVKSDNERLSLNEAMSEISYWITSIACFGIWEDDYIYNEKGCSELLWQVPNLLDIIEKKQNVYICKQSFYEIQQVENKDISYGLYKVFYTNFLGCISQYCTERGISKKVYCKIRKDLLLTFFCKYVVAKKLGSNIKLSKQEDLERALNKSYKGDYYYIIYKCKVNYLYYLAMLKRKIKQVINK